MNQKWSKYEKTAKLQKRQKWSKPIKVVWDAKMIATNLEKNVLNSWDRDLSISNLKRITLGHENCKKGNHVFGFGGHGVVGKSLTSKFLMLWCPRRLWKLDFGPPKKILLQIRSKKLQKYAKMLRFHWLRWNNPPLESVAAVGGGSFQRSQNVKLRTQFLPVVNSISKCHRECQESFWTNFDHPTFLPTFSLRNTNWCVSRKDVHNFVPQLARGKKLGRPFIY